MFLLRDFWVRCTSHRTLGLDTFSVRRPYLPTVWRLDFVQSGSVQFFNPGSPTEYEVMKPNPITMWNPTPLELDLVQQSPIVVLLLVILVTQENTNASGRFVGYGGSATGTLTLTNVGAGFTPSSGGHYTFTGIGLTAVTGNGLNATTDITIENGMSIGATIVNGGKGYTIGDVLEPISIGNLGLGEGMRLTVGNLYGQNQLIVENVQGTFSTGAYRQHPL